MSRTDYTLIPQTDKGWPGGEEDFIGIVENTGRMNYRNNRHWDQAAGHLKDNKLMYKIN